MCLWFCLKRGWRSVRAWGVYGLAGKLVCALGIVLKFVGLEGVRGALGLWKGCRAVCGVFFKVHGECFFLALAGWLCLWLPSGLVLQPSLAAGCKDLADWIRNAVFGGFAGCSAMGFAAALNSVARWRMAGWLMRSGQCRINLVWWRSRGFA